MPKNGRTACGTYSTAAPIDCLPQHIIEIELIMHIKSDIIIIDNNTANSWLELETNESVV